jgi:hypothetical protein
MARGWPTLLRTQLLSRLPHGIHKGETLLHVDRNGKILSSRGMEGHLEHEDPILDTMLFSIDNAGPLKGLGTAGKILMQGLEKDLAHSVGRWSGLQREAWKSPQRIQ